MNKHKIIVSVSGASGAIYTKVLFDKLQKLNKQIETVGVLMSDNAKYVWETELGNKDYESLPFNFYEKQDFTAPFASGSAQYKTMIICPCSMGTLGRISNGISNDLTTRAADVILKERRNFIGTGIDISKKCIKVSKYNAKRLKLNNRSKFYISDVDNFL